MQSEIFIGNKLLETSDLSADIPPSVSLSTTNEPSSSLVTLDANVACGAFKKPASRGPVCPQS